MKKVLAIFLSALLICISIAPMGCAASTTDPSTKIYEGGYNVAAVDSEVITQTTFTVAVNVPAVNNLVGVNLYLQFDPNVLAVADAGVAGVADENGNINAFFNGLPVNGYKRGSNSEYSFGWVSGTGVSKAEATDIFYITFNVINTMVTDTAINLYVDEFITNDGDDSNDIRISKVVKNDIICFMFPANTPPAEGTTSAGGGSSTSPDDINNLLQVIRDLLAGNGATFGDFVDAIVNLFGNAELIDIIEQLVDGNIDISEAFQNILDKLGVAFDFLEDLLNKIIEFLKGLFGPDETESTTAAGNPETTSPGSSSGSEETGDAGIALAATVCVAASAAFVLTRKKKETF